MSTAIIIHEITNRDIHSAPITLTNINALPNELIRHIFTFLAEFSTNAPQDHINATIAASQVCWTWRHISLSTPSIWARCLDYGLSDERVATVLARSGSERLDIVIPSFMPAFKEHSIKHTLPEETYGFNSEVVWMDYLDLSEFCEPHHYPGNPLPTDTAVFHRCDSLQLVVRDEFCRWEDCYPVLKDCLPSVKTLALMYEHERYFPTVLLMEAADVSHEYPWRVEALHLRNCIIPLELPLFGSLKNLTVCNMDPIGHLFTPNGWLQALENMPRLCVLSLRHVFTSAVLLSPQDPRREHRPITDSLVVLLELRSIELETTLPLGEQFMNRLCVPLDCSVKLTLDMFDDDIEASFNALCRDIQERYNTYDPTLCNCVMFSFTGTMCRIVVGTHWVDAQFGHILTDITIEYLPGPHARTIDFCPSEPLIKLLTAFRSICKEVPCVIVGRIGIFAFPGKTIYSMFQKAVFLVFEGQFSNLWTALVTFLIPPRKGDKVHDDDLDSMVLLPPLPALNVVVLLGRFLPEHIVNLRNFKKRRLTIHKLEHPIY